MTPELRRLIEWDKQYHWHPFTQMREWTRPEHEPVVIVAGQGALLYDGRDREFIDGNSSIWTNLHGHNHPALNEALRAQLDRIAHCSALGLTHVLAPVLARALVETLQPGCGHKVFFSDDGSTAIETAVKMAWQARRQRGETKRVRFLSLGGGYHGDTVGAMSVGQVPAFHSVFAGLLYDARKLRMPDTYRNAFDDAPPVRGVSSAPSAGGSRSICAKSRRCSMRRPKPRSRSCWSRASPASRVSSFTRRAGCAASPSFAARAASG